MKFKKTINVFVAVICVLCLCIGCSAKKEHDNTGTSDINDSTSMNEVDKNSPSKGDLTDNMDELKDDIKDTVDNVKDDLTGTSDADINEDNNTMGNASNNQTAN